MRPLLGESHEKRVFDLGCGNGAFARKLCKDGYSVQGIDPSEQGIQQAKASDASILLEVGSAYEPLAERFGKFPIVTSLEVVEHVYSRESSPNASQIYWSREAWRSSQRPTTAI